MPSLFLNEPIVPDDDLALLAGASMRTLTEGVTDRGDGTKSVWIDTPEGKRTLVLPAAIVDFLVNVLAHLKNREPVVIIPEGAELAIREAADQLNVPWQFMVGLLDRGEIPARGEGNFRRVVYRDLLAYKGQRDAIRRAALDEMAALSQEMAVE
jgi:hypothetical protein